MMDVATIMAADPATVAPDTSLDDALEVMDARGIRHLPVVADGALVGIVSDRDLLEATGWLPARLHACRGPINADRVPKRVREVLRAPVVTIGPAEGLDEALALLLRRRIGCLPVVADGALVGILTEQDVLAAFAAGRIAARTSARKAASVAPYTQRWLEAVHWDTTLGEAVDRCREAGVRHLPVVQAGELIGIVSDRDLRRALGCGRPETLSVGEIAAGQVVHVGNDALLPQVARLMTEHRISAVPIVEGGACVGLVTVTDVLERVLELLREPQDRAP
jgi:acetoin utilization protein AcuB